jgi:hypothetical protein
LKAVNYDIGHFCKKCQIQFQCSTEIQAQEHCGFLGNTQKTFGLNQDRVDSNASKPYPASAPRFKPKKNDESPQQKGHKKRAGE